jgi:hypothetical protein
VTGRRLEAANSPESGPPGVHPWLWRSQPGLPSRHPDQRRAAGAAIQPSGGRPPPRSEQQVHDVEGSVNRRPVVAQAVAVTRTDAGRAQIGRSHVSADGHWVPELLPDVPGEGQEQPRRCRRGCSPRNDDGPHGPAREDRAQPRARASNAQERDQHCGSKPARNRLLAGDEARTQARRRVEGSGILRSGRAGAVARWLPALWR